MQRHEDGTAAYDEYYQDELRLSARTIALALAIPLLVIIFLEPRAYDSFRLELFSALLAFLGAVAWVIADRHETVARWFLVLVSLGTAALLCAFFGSPYALFALGLAPVLATAMLGTKAGLGVACGSTVVTVSLSLLVLEVTGPILAARTARQTASRRPAGMASTKLHTVDELVKVTRSTRPPASRSTRCGGSGSPAFVR